MRTPYKIVWNQGEKSWRIADTDGSEFVANYQTLTDAEEALTQIVASNLNKSEGTTAQ